MAIVIIDIRNKHNKNRNTKDKIAIESTYKLV